MTQEDLVNLEPQHETFVGIDSDGCVFDTMEIKQKQCFHTMIIKHWGLEGIEAYVREGAEFVNLYSKGRGRNRFLCLIDTVDVIRNRPEVVTSRVTLPGFESLRKWCDSGVALGNPTLEQAVAETDDPELRAVLDWSLEVNEEVVRVASDVSPFAWAKKGLDCILGASDAIVVSQTPTETLVREWEKNGILSYVSLIAGQECGTKIEHLALATEGKYRPSRVLMIGDAPGDESAAKANQACFYPINPGNEEASWERFCSEAYDLFLAGTYEGEYEQACINEFHALLPEHPPWGAAL